MPCPICHSQKRAKASSSMLSSLNGVGSAEAYPVKAARQKWLFMRGSDTMDWAVAAPRLQHIRSSLVWPISSSLRMQVPGIRLLLAPGLSPHPFPGPSPGRSDAANVRRVAAILASPLGHREEWIRDAMTGLSMPVRPHIALDQPAVCGRRRSCRRWPSPFASRARSRVRREARRAAVNARLGTGAAV